MIYEETPKITTKKKMIEKNNMKIKEKQTLKEDERGHLVPEYQERKWVYLDVKNVRKDRSNKKLDYKYWGLFQIKKQINVYFYKLKLSKSIKVYLKFNTNRLKPYYEKTSEIEGNQSEVIKEVEEWEIEDI